MALIYLLLLRGGEAREKSVQNGMKVSCLCHKLVSINVTKYTWGKLGMCVIQKPGEQRNSSETNLWSVCSDTSTRTRLRKTEKKGDGRGFTILEKKPAASLKFYIVNGSSVSRLAVGEGGM